MNMVSSELSHTLNNYVYFVKILITNFWLNQFNDSEIFCFEFIKHCKSSGHEVDIYALDIDSSMRTYCVDNGITLYDANSSFATSHYDLIWMHHNVIPRDFLLSSKSALKASVLVSHHISAFEPNDVSFFPIVKSKLADRILANTFDVKILLKELGFDEERIEIIGSPAPKDFIGYESSTLELNRFLFISNDPPKNVVAAVDMLETIGFEVKRIDRTTFIGNRDWISPSDFKWADAIVSIEETIPYAVLSHRPIYLYNKYSGLSWVVDDSELNNAYLREGRLQGEVNSLSVSVIVEQLLSGFEDARTYINNLDQESTKKFQFEPVVENVVGTLNNSLSSNSNCFDRITTSEKVSWLATQDTFIREIQTRKFAEASAKQALLERLIVVEKLESAESELVSLRSPAIFEVDESSITSGNSRKRILIPGRAKR